MDPAITVQERHVPSNAVSEFGIERFGRATHREVRDHDVQAWILAVTDELRTRVLNGVRGHDEYLDPLTLCGTAHSTTCAVTALGRIYLEIPRTHHVHGQLSVGEGARRFTHRPSPFAVFEPLTKLL